MILVLFARDKLCLLQGTNFVHGHGVHAGLHLSITVLYTTLCSTCLHVIGSCFEPKFCPIVKNCSSRRACLEFGTADYADRLPGGAFTTRHCPCHDWALDHCFSQCRCCSKSPEQQAPGRPAKPSQRDGSHSVIVIHFSLLPINGNNGHGVLPEGGALAYASYAMHVVPGWSLNWVTWCTVGCGPPKHCGAPKQTQALQTVPLVQPAVQAAHITSPSTIWQRAGTMSRERCRSWRLRHVAYQVHTPVLTLICISSNLLTSRDCASVHSSSTLGNACAMLLLFHSSFPSIYNYQQRF